MQFDLVQDVKVLFGVGKLSELGRLATAKGSRSPLIVTDKGIVAAGILDRVLAVLQESGLDAKVFDEVLPDPSTSLVEQGWSAYTESMCDLVIGLGGGSAMDTAKAINILRFNKGPILRFANNAEMKPSPGLIVIPTTSGTGSELSDGLVISGEAGEKHAILATLATAEYALVDPALMVGMPTHITASTGFDALAHAVESYTSTSATLLSDMVTASIIETVIRWLPRAVLDGTNIEARSHMAAACLMSGWMLRYGHTHAGHSIAHAVGSHFPIPHGFACAYALPHVLEFNAPACPEKSRWLAKQFGVLLTGCETEEELGAKLRRAVISFRDVDLHIGNTSAWTIDRTAFPEMAAEIAEDIFQEFNPRTMTKEHAQELLEKLF